MTVSTENNHEPCIKSLRDVFGDTLITSKAVCDQHGTDESFHHPHSPDGVLFARSREDVIKAVNICAQHGTPIIPYGTGTSLEGHVAALNGGLCIDTSNMNQILHVNQQDADCVIQPGVKRMQLNEYLRDTGLFFPIDPGADASVGGMVSTRASGTNAVRYGTMRNNVLSLEVVLANGKAIKTATRARKSSAGYDLTALMVGSEGTLGLITEVTLKLFGIPDAISAAVCTFPSVDDAVNTTITTIQCGVPIARIELLDAMSISAVNAYSKLNLTVAPTLFMEFHGSAQSVKEQSELVDTISSQFGGSQFNWTTKTEERTKLWQARHDAAYACRALRKNCEFMATDVCVPISKLAECIKLTQQDIEESALIAPILGHVGDGNFHLGLIVDPNDESEIKRAHALHERLVYRALEMEGTCTGEHGIGYGKIDFLEAELGESTEIMRMIKKTLDPLNIMNPGKIINL